MKYFLLIVLVASVFFSPAFSQTIAVTANMNTGLGAQQHSFDNAYGIGTKVEIPFKKMTALHFTAGLDVGINGFKNMPYELDFEGSVTNTSVNYTNYLFQLSPGLKYIFREGKVWTPYVSMSAGLLSYYTEMSIEDSDNPLGCSPAETEPVSFSMILAGTAETGVRIRTQKHSGKGLSYIEAGVGLLAGTRGKYLQLSNKHENDAESYLVKFRQNSTGMVHEHSIGTMHRTTANQLAAHVGFIFPL